MEGIGELRVAFGKGPNQIFFLILRHAMTIAGNQILYSERGSLKLESQR